ncbi:SDR family oxidoreductase [Halomonas daqingensis]|uniref:SDR family oxidoreductase n=1 Tax=Billgrantia desiderata TaxID=52021 RepID=A0ABS9B1Y3_9GAMM|nr:SDR family oxidoreductase [Halomonas desiderata]MCE8010575.1 SDR family oxidoreductase [Halomonas desiderata]MCE8030684.1 SDR family oxidoreductase [Halomonas desiderata]MCE8041338.1 SDR family oxidoreductase [Halomonas desiderata]MCE8045913.1 SDR family oxidoreductase [Halomonas desiderata]OUE37094.1 NAD(P)-dependent oxidoreductase [Halomonas desiderata SP1]
MSDEKQPPQEQSHQPGAEYKMDPQPEYIRDSYRGADKLKDKVAIITGGDSGIGRAVAVHYAREGADCVIVHLEEDTDARDTQQLVEAEGRRCLVLKGDVGEPSFCDEIVDRTLAEFGKLNIVVHNAAEQYDWDDITEIPPDQLQRTFQTNVFSHFYLTKAALPHMGEGDSIICTSSINAFKGNPTLIDYTATKGAIQGLVRSLAVPLAEKGIRVNSVAPGPVWTPLIPASFDAEKVASFGGQVPMNRAGQPSEMGPAYVYLACEESSYMSGQTLHLNGGVVLNT